MSDPVALAPTVLRPEEYRRLVEDYRPLAYRLAARYHRVACLMGLALDREDMIQEAILALVTNVPRFDPTRAGFYTYASLVLKRHLCRVLGQRCHRRWKQVPLVKGDNGDQVELEQADERRAPDPGLREQAAGLLKLLPPRWQRIVRLYFGFGCRPATSGEIAAQLGVSRSRIGQILQRAVARLRRLAGVDGRAEEEPAAVLALA